MWIPHRPGDLATEALCQDIMKAARDSRGQVKVSFLKFEEMNRTAECIVERYDETYIDRVVFELLH